ncbi:MAG: type VI secretion system contractile sheath large subunit [Planctomycetaceae bacterium]|nr:type VI secretion system contractile sheath large subunit [Planctomycetaceae bacterium]
MAATSTSAAAVGSSAAFREPSGQRRPSAPASGFIRDIAVAATPDRGVADLLQAQTPAETLRAWAARRVGLGERLSLSTLLARLGEDIAAIDVALSRQLDAILHHTKFQQLESSWRGLAWMVGQTLDANDAADGRSRVEVRILSVTKRELARDRSDAVEFDRSVMWRKIYEEEFGTAGGTPYGLLVADYQFSHHPDDVSLLTGLAEVSAAAFAPLLVNPAAELLGLDRFQRLDALPVPDTYQSSPDFVKWRALRDREESRFIGLPLPRVLGRLPYDGWIGRPDGAAADERSWANRGFRYHEEADRADGSGRLWNGAVWPLAGVVIREFGRSGWFADIRGGSRGLEGGGVVEGLPVDGFTGLDRDAATRGPVEVFVTEPVQMDLDGAGLIPLCASGADGRAVFHTNASLHASPRYESAIATANARISSMLQYVLCVSRFAHYLKVMGRDKVGAFTDAPSFERFLSEWVNQYVTPDDQASAETRAKMPLRAASVEVREEPGSAGAYRVVMRLQPHFQLDRLDATLRLVTQVRRADKR